MWCTYTERHTQSTSASIFEAHSATKILKYVWEHSDCNRKLPLCSVLESVQRIEDKKNQVCTKHNKSAVKGRYYDNGLIIANSDLITKIDLKYYHTNHFLGEVIKRDILLALLGANILIKKGYIWTVPWPVPISPLLSNRAPLINKV